MGGGGKPENGKFENNFGYGKRNENDDNMEKGGMKGEEEERERIL